MRHKQLKFLLIFLLTVLAIPIATAGEKTVTFDFTSGGTGNSSDITIDDVTLNLTAGSQSATWTTFGYLNYVFNSILTFSSSSNITKIEFTATRPSNSGTYASNKTFSFVTLNSGGGTWIQSTGIWTGQSNSVAFRNYDSDGSSYKVIRVTKIIVTYEGEDLPYEATVSPEALAFGKLAVDGTKTMEVTLKNSGANAFTPSVSISGTGFSTTYTAAGLASKASTTIPVTFNPATAGDFTGTMTINCGDAGTFTVVLSGNAAMEATIADGTSTSSYLPVYGLYYDEQTQHNQMIYPESMLTSLVGKKLKSMTFYNGSATSYFSGGNVKFSLGTTTQSAFSTASIVVPDDLTQVYSAAAPGGTLTEWVVTFDEGFVYNGGNLLIDVQTEKGTFKSVTFQGITQTGGGWYSYNNSTNGIQNFLPKVTFAFEDAAGTVTVNPASLAFEAFVGESAEQSVTVKNTTDAAAAISISGDSQFSIKDGVSSVAAGETATITVVYAPTAAGSHSATLTAGDKTVTITGVATAKTTTGTVTPASVDFGNVVVGNTGSATITIANTGNQPFTPAFSSLEAPFSLSYTAGEIAAGGNATATVSFAPTAIEQYSGSFTVTIGEQEPNTVALSGAGAEPTIAGTVSPTSISFGDKVIGDSYTQTITITNTGDAPFTPTLYTANLPEQFSISGNGEVAVDGTRELTVTYAPTAVGNHSGSFNITIGGSTTTVNVGGNGVETPASGDLTVADGTTTNTYAPMNAAEEGTAVGQRFVQMIYPADMLTDLKGKMINKVKFYMNKTNGYWYNAEYEISVGETTRTSFAVQTSRITDLTKVATYKVVSGTNYIEIELDNPYLYNGGNLVIETFFKTKGTHNRTEFYGQATSENAYLVGGASISGSPNYKFLPKTTFSYERPAILVLPTDGKLAYGEVSTTGSKTLNVTVTNNSPLAVTPTLSTIADSHFTTNFTGEIPAGATVNIPVRFAPTEAASYESAVTITINGTDYVFTLTGSGRVNKPTMTADDFAQITYDWIDGEGNKHELTPMTEVATSAEQMVALMKAVYTNPEVPGSIYRGFTAEGAHEQDLVSYPAIGTVSSSEYDDTYGWGIENKNPLVKIGSSDYLDPTDYLPNEEGLTLLLVEMNDNAVAEAKAAEYGFATPISGSSDFQSTSTYDDLVKKFDVMFKSVRVLTSSKNIGGGMDAGTLFKIDCDKMNRFFLLGKGRLRTYYTNTVYAPDGAEGTYQVQKSSAVTMAPFYDMFEQFSPNLAVTGTDAQSDIYQNLINMESFAVVHDCVSVPSVDGHHEFNLYGVDSESDDCQDVRDMMLFIPEHRMTAHDYNEQDEEGNWATYKRDASDNDHYVNYYTSQSPKIGLFVIRQNAITGEQMEGQDKYRLHLTWKSNLLDFLPGEDGQYTLYRVEYVDGTRTYVPVGEFDPNTFEYYDEIDMLQNGQQVTYVVRGQDAEKFLTLQYSNEESFIIPGLDKAEQLRLALNSDFYYSRFFPQTQKNYYSNRLIVNNNIGTNVKAKYLEEGSEFKFWRVPNEIVDNQIQFATVKVTAKANGSGTVQIIPDATREDYWDGTEYPYGFKAMPTEATFTYDANDENSDVQFDGLSVYDNFCVSVEGNSHPDFYGYYVSLETAAEFELEDGTTSTAARSNSISVPIHKTEMTMQALTKDDVDADTDHALPISTQFDINVKHSSKTEILRYDAYRWPNSEYGTTENPFTIIDMSSEVDNEQDIAPNGLAGNQGESYTIAMNDDFTSSVAVSGEDGQTYYPARFEDNFVATQTKGDAYTYAPVVELFAPAGSIVDGEVRDDYNTYGAPLQVAAGGVVKVSNTDVLKADYQWTKDNQTYAYYNVCLTVDVADIPEGYNLYKVRAWRKAGDVSKLGEELAEYQERVTEEYLFDELTYGKDDWCDKSVIKDKALGSEVITGKVQKGTFGAKELGTDEELPLEFTVRAYFTRQENLTDGDAAQNAPRREPTASASEAYYIAETTHTVTITGSGITTGIADVNHNAAKQVSNVTYYNMVGAASTTPFSGVNVVVTRYTDGTTTTNKVVK